jgi:hypothetical protein
MAGTAAAGDVVCLTSVAARIGGEVTATPSDLTASTTALAMAAGPVPAPRALRPWTARRAESVTSEGERLTMWPHDATLGP